MLLYISRNRFLVIVVSLIVLISVFVIGGIIWTRSQPATTTTIPLNSVSRGVFTLYQRDGKYYVESREATFTDKQIIRNTLGIPPGIDFEIVIPAAANPRIVEGDPPPADIGPEPGLGD